MAHRRGLAQSPTADWNGHPNGVAARWHPAVSNTGGVGKKQKKINCFLNRCIK